MRHINNINNGLHSFFHGKIQASTLHALVVGDTNYQGFWGYSRGANEVVEVQSSPLPGFP